MNLFTNVNVGVSADVSAGLSVLVTLVNRAVFPTLASNVYRSWSLISGASFLPQLCCQEMKATTFQKPLCFFFSNSLYLCHKHGEYQLLIMLCSKPVQRRCQVLN